MVEKKFHTLIIGSGASGLCTAVRLHALGITDIAIYTEGLSMGTSINTGSDKQTYYKLGMYSSEADSPVFMAQDLAKGGSMHGDIALCEAALSPIAFSHLTTLGVPFPHDIFGQYIGYKTDHDPKRRATSCGPYTSKEMCLALIKEVKRRNIQVFENRFLGELLIQNNKACGAVFLNMDEKDSSKNMLEKVNASNVVLATGGPGGLYRTSVYPQCHTGSGIGAALQKGVKARNLPESQFGMASIKFRWNVSGSYMQVIPRIFSVDANGVEREFLKEYFKSDEELLNRIFLKGYQWPFSYSHAITGGSSLLDIFVWIETEEKQRRVFLDYRQNPSNFDFDKLNEETKSYLISSNATGNTPLARLLELNKPAYNLYLDHDIDLAKEPLEIAVCAQHCNGGLAGNCNWESENISNLYIVGEVNGSHGVTRPGGSALNAGQAGAFRAAEKIARSKENFVECNNVTLSAKFDKAYSLNILDEINLMQTRMSLHGAFVRRAENIDKAIAETIAQLNKVTNSGLANASVTETILTVRTEQLLYAQLAFLSAIKFQIASKTGSRGGAIIADNSMGVKIHEKLSFNVIKEDESFKKQVLTTCFDGKEFYHQWEDCRQVPNPDGWFEKVWKEYQEQSLCQ